MDAVTETDQRDLGDSDSPIEDELEDAFNRMIGEGTQRLHRPWREVLTTGFFGGTEVAMGVLAYLSVLNATHNPLLAGLAFSIGFLALLLGRSELFTEGFLVPVTTVVAKRASVGQLLKLWSGTLVANLVGGWLIMWLIMTGFPKLQAQTIESARHFVDAPLSPEIVGAGAARRHGHHVDDPHAARHRLDARQDRRRRRGRVPAWPGCRCSTRSWTRC